VTCRILQILETFLRSLAAENIVVPQLANALLDLLVLPINLGL